MSPTFGLRVEACIDTSTDRPVQRVFDDLLPEEGDAPVARARGERRRRRRLGRARILRTRIGRRAHAARRRRAESGGGTQPLSLDELERRIQAMPECALKTAPKSVSLADARQKLLLMLRGDAGLRAFRANGQRADGRAHPRQFLTVAGLPNW